MRLTGLWWWIDRWRTSTAFTDMTLEQQGAYRNLLDEAALRGGAIPNNEETLAKACGDAQNWWRLRQTVMGHFDLNDEHWFPRELGLLFQPRSRWVRVPGERPKRPDVSLPLRRFVMARDRVCVFCGSDSRPELDHITRWRDGGRHSEDNLRVLCRPCNRRRG